MTVGTADVLRSLLHEVECRMSVQGRRYLRFGVVIVVIVVSLAYLAYTGVRDSKSYYVTIKELNGMGNDAYSKRLRVAGNVAPGSIKRQGTHLEFLLAEEGRTIPVVYAGSEAPPDTFKDNAQALAEGKYGRDGVFHATNIQAKCASKYAPKPGVTPAAGETPQKAELTGAQSGNQGQ
jgi:cytochrome c-type biogenesis protein CcmE